MLIILLIIIIIITIVINIKIINNFTNLTIDKLPIEDNCIDIPFVPLSTNVNIDISNNISNLSNNIIGKDLINNISSVSIDNASKNKKCCLIEKKYIDDEFKYIYTKLKNNDCNYDNYNLDNNKQLLIENVNNWSNDYCNDLQSEINNSASNFSLEKMLGSCRQNNHECIDFISKDYCQSENLVWDKMTCNSQLPYKFVDKRILVQNEKNYDNNFRIF